MASTTKIPPVLQKHIHFKEAVDIAYIMAKNLHTHTSMIMDLNSQKTNRDKYLEIIESKTIGKNIKPELIIAELRKLMPTDFIESFGDSVEIELNMGGKFSTIKTPILFGRCFNENAVVNTVNCYKLEKHEHEYSRVHFMIVAKKVGDNINFIILEFGSLNGIKITTDGGKYKEISNNTNPKVIAIVMGKDNLEFDVGIGSKKLKFSLETLRLQNAGLSVATYRDVNPVLSVYI